MVDALFIDPRGPYPGLLGVEHCWDEKRDARTYAGPGPVVAHPPCQLWGNMAAAAWGRWHKRLPAWYPGGDDGGCFAAALAAVRKNGGVLEHPAGSHAFDVFNGPYYTRPSSKGGWEIGDEWGEWICTVWQSAYGHLADKATIVLYVGARAPFELDWRHVKGTHQVGWPDSRGKARNKPTLSKALANATPLRFAAELIRLAAWSRG
jgi:hypothetical protein